MYQQPKIFLIDTHEAIHKALQKNWANIGTGTLGIPYKVPTASGWRPVIQNKALRKFEESDLIIIDLAPKGLADKASGEKHAPDEEVDLWAKCDKGWIDARVRTVLLAKKDFNRIVMNGGVLIIFAGPDSPMEFQWASSDHRGLVYKSGVSGGVWNLVEPMDSITVVPESGSAISVTGDSPIRNLLKRHLDGAEFTCTFKPNWANDKTWTSLATNKYGLDVSLVAEHGYGVVMIFPQLADKSSFIGELLGDVLPEIIPGLFPEIEKGMWTHLPEYELEQVIELEAKKIIVTAKAEKELNNIQQEIIMHRSANGWLHDLITGTGDDLVNAVKIALSELGFERVVDVDEIRDAEGKSRREDLRIEDGDATLIIDIKGVGGKASDDDLMQANKHAMINMKELNKTTMQGLSIINQQRHLPPLQRDNNEPFRQEILDFAGETGLGLMTTFDLYRIVVNKRRHGWSSNWVKPLFYGHQRITTIPVHYQYIGTVSKVYTEVFGIHILENGIQVGDYLSVEGDIYFEEVEVESIQVNKVDVKSATVGDPAGFKWRENAMRLREGMRVYALPKALLGLKAQP
ncbi:hypothetical protein PS907_01165 [Pseudomonas fluorescens]|nr:hypothetical protein PS907_01165 [Pseudomonas fluorescens]